MFRSLTKCYLIFFVFFFNFLKYLDIVFFSTGVFFFNLYFKWNLINVKNDILAWAFSFFIRIIRIIIFIFIIIINIQILNLKSIIINKHFLLQIIIKFKLFLKFFCITVPCFNCHYCKENIWIICTWKCKAYY